MNLTVNTFKGGSKLRDKPLSFDHCVLRDPREALPENWTGYEVITAADGGKLVTWSRLNITQIQEAKDRFEELIQEGLVPYYTDPDTGNTSELVMDEFDPAAGSAIFEQSDFDPRNLRMVPTGLATGG